MFGSRVESQWFSKHPALAVRSPSSLCHDWQLEMERHNGDTQGHDPAVGLLALAQSISTSLLFPGMCCSGTPPTFCRKEEGTLQRRNRAQSSPRPGSFSIASLPSTRTGNGGSAPAPRVPPARTEVSPFRSAQE